MQNFSTSPKEMISSIWSNRSLILALIKREVIGRYKGSVIGIAWSFFTPVLMLITYTFVFSVVFKARWGLETNQSKIDFAIILFVGLIVHGLFAECINRAPNLILSNVNYVKKVIFPLEILSPVAFGSALFHAIISLCVMLVSQLILNHYMPLTVFMLPIILLPLTLATLGFSWFLAGFGVYVRDVGQITGIITTVLLFVSAVFFPISALPPPYQGWLKLNPLVIIIEQSRDVLIFGRLPDFTLLFTLLSAGFLIAWAGFAWFQKTRKGFADVI